MENQFTKEFPSLKDEAIAPTDNNCMVEGNLFLKKDIQEHCLDKQRVRDALYKFEMLLTKISVNLCLPDVDADKKTRDIKKDTLIAVIRNFLKTKQELGL